MKKFSFFAAAMLLLSVMANATIRRVGYSGITRTGVDYADIATAQTASSAGDTIQIYPGAGSASGTITKRLVLLGFGYNFDVHANLQATNADAPSQVSLDFYPGSDSSIVEGCSGSFRIGSQSSSTPTAVSKIIIRRCYISNLYFYNNYAIVNDVKIISCVSYSIQMLYSIFPVTNLQVYNSSLYFFSISLAGSSGSIINCVTASPNYGNSISFGNAGFLVKNSILNSYNASSTNTVYESNFFSTTQPATLPPGSNNRWGQVWANLFARTAAGTDAAGYINDATFDENYYILKTGSLAINGGTDSGGNPTDAGIFGGDALYRYKLSGVPAVPAIYKLTAPTTAATTNPYNITVSVRSNN